MLSYQQATLWKISDLLVDLDYGYQYQEKLESSHYIW